MEQNIHSFQNYVAEDGTQCLDFTYYTIEEVSLDKSANFIIISIDFRPASCMKTVTFWTQLIVMIASLATLTVKLFPALLKE